MSIHALLELLSNQTHRADIQALIASQPENIKSAFLTNDTDALRRMMPNAEILADRDKVVKINF